MGTWSGVLIINCSFNMLLVSSLFPSSLNNWWNFCQTMNNVTTQPRHWKFNSNQIHFDWLFISIVESDFIPLWYRSPVTGVDPNPLFWRVTNYALQICSHGQNTVSDNCLTVECTQYTSKGLSKCTHQIVSLYTVSTQARRFIRSVCAPSVLLQWCSSI